MKDDKEYPEYSPWAVNHNAQSLTFLPAWTWPSSVRRGAKVRESYSLGHLC